MKKCIQPNSPGVISMHPCQLLLMFSCFWPVDGKSRTPSTPDPLEHPLEYPHNRRSHTLKHGHTMKRSQATTMRIPKSVTDPDCIPTDGTAYTGNANTTKSGLTCQMWSVNTPNEHDYNDVGEHNYCRSPDGDDIWCITTDPRKKWEYCDVPVCVTYTKGIDLLNILYSFI